MPTGCRPAQFLPLLGNATTEAVQDYSGEVLHRSCAQRQLPPQRDILIERSLYSLCTRYKVQFLLIHSIKICIGNQVEIF